MNKLALFFFGALCLLLATESDAWAWSRTPFPYDAEGPASTCIVAAASPSKEHPWGTALIFDATRDEILALEWDVLRNREVRRRVVVKQSDPDVRRAHMLKVVRSRDRIFLLAGSDQGNGMVALFELDTDANVLWRESIGAGEDPDVAVDDDWIVVGYYGLPLESRPDDQDPLPFLRFYHVSVRERGSRRVVGARELRNGGYLSGGTFSDAPHLVLLGGRSYFALQDDKKTYLVSARMPSLAIERQVALPTTHAGSIGGKDPRLYTVGRSLVVLAGAWYEYAPTLDRALELPGEDLYDLAANATGSFVLLGLGRVAPRPDTVVLRAGRYTNAVAIVWGHPMYLRLGSGGTEDPRVVAVGP